MGELARPSFAVLLTPNILYCARRRVEGFAPLSALGRQLAGANRARWLPTGERTPVDFAWASRSNKLCEHWATGWGRPPRSGGAGTSQGPEG